MSLHLYQHPGPITINDRVQIQTKDPSHRIRHLGIQIPYNTPFPFVVGNENVQELQIRIVTNDIPRTRTYRLSPNGILEFSDLNATELIITIPSGSTKSLPKETIIDVLVDE